METYKEIELTRICEEYEKRRLQLQEPTCFSFSYTKILKLAYTKTLKLAYNKILKLDYTNMLKLDYTKIPKLTLKIT